MPMVLDCRLVRLDWSDWGWLIDLRRSRTADGSPLIMPSTFSVDDEPLRLPILPADRVLADDEAKDCLHICL